MTCDDTRRMMRCGFEDSIGTSSRIVAPVVVYVDDGTPPTTTPNSTAANNAVIDDFSFVRTVIELERESGLIDSTLIFAVGFASGGAFVLSLPPKLGDMICAIAVVAALVPKALTTGCTWPLPCPVMFIVGDDDCFVPLGGFGTKPSSARKGKAIVGAVATIQHATELTAHQKLQLLTSVGLVSSLKVVAGHNDLVVPISPTWSLPHADVYDVRFPFPTPQPAIRGFTKGCPALSAIVVRGGGHTWPGGRKLRPRSTFGKTSQLVDACSEIWGFFVQVASNMER